MGVGSGGCSWLAKEGKDSTRDKVGCAHGGFVCHLTLTHSLPKKKKKKRVWCVIERGRGGRVGARTKPGPYRARAREGPVVCRTCHDGARSYFLSPLPSGKLSLAARSTLSPSCGPLRPHFQLFVVCQSRGARVPPTPRRRRRALPPLALPSHPSLP